MNCGIHYSPENQATLGAVIKIDNKIIAKNLQKTLISFKFKASMLDDLAIDLLTMSYSSIRINTLKTNEYDAFSGVIKMSWLINGYFATDKSNNFLKDIMSRFLYTIGDAQSEFEIKAINSDEKGVELKEIAKYLKSLPSKKQKKNKTDLPKSKIACSQSEFDRIFWSLKEDMEALIRSYCRPLSADEFAEYAVKNYNYENSTLRAKGRSIYKWYVARDFKIFRRSPYIKKYTTPEQLKGLKMTRQEHAKKLSYLKKSKNKGLIEGLIKGLYSKDYKKPNGSWNITKLAEDTKLSRQSIYEHLKEMGEFLSKSPKNQEI